MPSLAALATDLSDELENLAALAPKTAGNGATPGERTGATARTS
jgi:hypothetical protein